MIDPQFFLLSLVLCLMIILFFVSKATNQKGYLKLKYRSLPNHVERSFFKALRKSAREHQYSGFLSVSRFFLRRLFNHILHVISKIVPYSGLRILLHKLRGVKIGRRVHIGPSVSIDDVYPNYVIIEEGVSIAGLNFILTHSKPLDFHSKLSDSFVAPVVIKENAWIAIGVIILPGITIGKGSIIASGSVVTANIPDNVFAGGCPAKVLKQFELDENGKPISFKQYKDK